MNKQGPFTGNPLQDKWLSRRSLIRGAAGAALGAGLLHPKPAHADDDEDRQGAGCNQVNPIPGGLAPFKPFGVFVHHNPLNPATPLANISDPSQDYRLRRVCGFDEHPRGRNRNKHRDRQHHASRIPGGHGLQ
jgi:hypothetical protein